VLGSHLNEAWVAAEELGIQKNRGFSVKRINQTKKKRIKE